MEKITEKQKYEKRKSLFSNKNFLIISAVSLVILIIAFIACWYFVLWLNDLGKQQVKKPLPAENTGTTTVYGVQMQNSCADQFQDFIKNYGQDYSKCLVDFDFNEENCGGYNPDTKGLSDVNIIVILDSSGSMADKINGQAKIDIAKKTISDFLSQMPEDVNTGLIVYGDKGSSSLADKSLSCKGIEEVVKLGPNNSSNIISAMNSFNPEGWTPIAGSLDFAKNIFLNSGTDNRNYLVLVSDGVEDCDGDPLAEAENLELAVSGIKLDIIGFTQDAKTQDYLQRVAGVGNGSYLAAYSLSDMARAFNSELLLIKKDCINMTLFQISSRYNNNNLNNLNCWLAAYKKESDDFTANVASKSFDTECNLEMSQALQARQNGFWGDKEALIEKDDAIFNKIKSDFNNQLDALDSQGN